jgi:hypothetical protein
MDYTARHGISIRRLGSKSLVNVYKCRTLYKEYGDTLVSKPLPQ